MNGSLISKDLNELNEESIVCRTCLKVLGPHGLFTYIDDDKSYVNNVGSLREMLQFCIPELDLYVSSHPVMCHQCLPKLVEVYNFKIKCLNGENTIKSYIVRKNLQDYNHVNLNCVLMDDLKLKTQKLKTQGSLENRSKNSLKEIPETTNDLAYMMQKTLPLIPIDSEDCLNTTFPKHRLLNHEDNHEILDDESMEVGVTLCEKIENDTDIMYDENTSSVDVAENLEEQIDEDDDFVEPVDWTDGISQETDQPNDEDLSSEHNSSSTSQQSSDSPKALVINNAIVPQQNGRIVIKIDKKRLQTITPSAVIVNSIQNLQLKDSIDSEDALVTSGGEESNKNNPASSTDTANFSIRKELTAQNNIEDTYQCNKCSFTTTDVIKMYDHNRTYHNFDYTCQHCPFSTSKVELLGKHMNMVHPQNMMIQQKLNFKVTENFACSLCPFSVKSLELLRSHHSAAHGCDKGPIVLNSAFQDKSVTLEPKILRRLEYTCDICPYTTKDKSNLRKHLFTHGTKPLKCDECPYKCVSPYQLRRHQKQKHFKKLEPRARNQPYQLPDLKKENADAENIFKITMQTIQREIDRKTAASLVG